MEKNSVSVIIQQDAAGFPFEISAAEKAFVR